MRQSARSVPRVPRGVVALGLVSLFMDLSSEMIHGLLPFFLVTVLKTSALGFLLLRAAQTGHRP